jgi:ABC-type multidrug transport system ATPase subunit/peptidoglycan/LPS O-acetylase OafA/YrhL
MTLPIAQSGERLHALDAVRGLALLLGVVLHATMSFLPGLGATGWPIADRSPSIALGVAFYVIHMFRMTTFFVIAGFFARLLRHRYGVRGFIGNRATRIVVPLVAGWIILFPLIALAFAWGAPAVRVAPTTAPSIAPPPLPFPLAHLWFLYVLILLYAATLAVREAVIVPLDRGGKARMALDRLVGASVVTPLAPVLAAVPLTLTLWMLPDWLGPNWFGWFGIPTPDRSLVPNLPATVAFATAFAVGWMLQRQMHLLAAVQRWWALHLGASIALTVVCLSIVGVRPVFSGGPVEQRLWYSAAYAIASWTWSFAIIGTALRFCSGASPARRYVADASYWIYLVHLPLIFFLQGAVAAALWPWAMKFGAILLVAFALLFASYHFLVRRSFVGALLNGRPGRHRLPGLQSATAAGDFASENLAVLEDARKRYGMTQALDGVSIDVRPGELLAILGPNGAGKSTAISLLLGLQAADSGSARLFGWPPDEIEARYQVGVMMQEASLAPELRVRDAIALVASYYPSPMTADEAMALTQTTALANRPYAKLSGGQKRQVQFAVAVCGQPALLFLDEPTVGLDVQAREMLWATLRRLVAEGSSIVLTTHYLEEAEALADRVIVLAKGRLVASGSVDEMRALVARKHVSCVTTIDAETLRTWPGVTKVTVDSGRTRIVTTDADAVVRRLLLADAGAHDLDVQRAGLAEAFAELTQEAA